MFLHQTSSLFSESAHISTPKLEEFHAALFLFYFDHIFLQL